MQTATKLQIEFISKWAIAGTILTLSLTWLLLKTYVFTPTISIETLNFPTETSQIFYKKNSPYSEQNSSISRISKNNDTYEFPLPIYDDDLRWDPLETAGEFSVKSIYISILGHHLPVDMQGVTASFQIEKTIKNGLTHFIAPPNSTDPQINIHIRSNQIDNIKYITAISIAALIALTTIAGIIFHRAILEFFQREKEHTKNLKSTFEKNNISTLGDMVGIRKNNFDILRLGAALVVLITHSFVLSGHPSDTWSKLFLGYEPGSLAVYAFFAISGFLIAGSLERRSFSEYWQARVLRIVPALAVTSFVTVLIIGPIFTTLPLSEYFHSHGTYHYLTNSIPYQTNFILPGVFTDLPFAQSVNGSLWTIPIEAFCYVALATIFFAARKTFNLIIPTIVLISTFFIWTFFHGPISPTILFGTSEVTPVLRFGLMFLIGTAFWKYKDITPFKGGIAASCLVVMLIGSRFGYNNLALFISLPYLLLYLAYRRPVFEEGMRKLGDLSYGTYLFAFPIQQSLVSISEKSINGWWLSISTAMISMGLAWMSWRFIEKPAMKLKKKFGTPAVFERTV